MLTASILFFLSATLTTPAPPESGGGIDPALARRYFQELDWASHDDGGRAWGHALAGPTLFFEAATGAVVANQADAEGDLREQDGVFVGTVPKEFAGANTALDWAGVHWTVVVWPLPESTFDRMRLLMHESWHRIQAELGLPSTRQPNEHLATKDGRIWMLMEYRALTQALPAWGPERRRALEDALAFRAYRRGLFPDAAAQEDRMEVHEGLAEYTGFRAGGLDNGQARHLMAGRLELAALKSNLSYAFAYETGPAYGLLLDMDDDAWRERLKPASSLSALLAAQAGIEVGQPELAGVLARAEAYDGAALIAAEEERAAEHEAALERYRANLVHGPVLVLPLVHSQFTFDPNAVVPLEGEGTVYVGCRFVDDWGILEVSGAALVGASFDRLRVPAPATLDARAGASWTLDLAEGWTLAAGEREGDLAVARR
jgi:hypothetical protein